MATHAKITSTDALEVFRASLIVFVNKAQSALDQASDEIRRTRGWIQHDQRTYWENEARRRARALAQAEQELLSARMTKALDNLSAQQAAVNKARHALEEAAEKVRRIKLWMRDFDGMVEPLVKGLNSLRGLPGSRSAAGRRPPHGNPEDHGVLCRGHDESPGPGQGAGCAGRRTPGRGAGTAIMSSEAESSLAAAMQNLNVAWQEVRGHWRDAKAIEFEERYLKELPSRTTQAAAVMAEIDKLLKKARNDCA